MNTTRRIWALVTVSLATFMTYLDNNIVNVAIPAIQRDLHLTTSGAGVGRERLHPGVRQPAAGRRPARPTSSAGAGCSCSGSAIFTAASLVAGLAGGAEVLIAARAVQGLGAALVTPTTLAIISATFTTRANARGCRHLERRSARSPSRSARCSAA